MANNEPPAGFNTIRTEKFPTKRNSSSLLPESTRSNLGAQDVAAKSDVSSDVNVNNRRRMMRQAPCAKLACLLGMRAGLR